MSLLIDWLSTEINKVAALPSRNFRCSAPESCYGRQYLFLWLVWNGHRLRHYLLVLGPYLIAAMTTSLRLVERWSCWVSIRAPWVGVWWVMRIGCFSDFFAVHDGNIHYHWTIYHELEDKILLLISQTLFPSYPRRDGTGPPPSEIHEGEFTRCVWLPSNRDSLDSSN